MSGPTSHTGPCSTGSPPRSSQRPDDMFSARCHAFDRKRPMTSLKTYRLSGWGGWRGRGSTGEGSTAEGSTAPLRAKRRNGPAVRRVLSRRPKPAWTVISLGALLPVPSSSPPADSAGRVIVCCLALLRTRFTWPPVLPRTPVGSYPTLSALPAAANHGRRSTLCCTFSRVAPGGRYPPFSPAEPGRSSARRRKRRVTQPSTGPFHVPV